MTCSAATPKLSEQEISEKLSRLSGWRRCENWIEKKFQFKNFLRAMSFVNAVAYVAESINHHPDIIIHYNEVTVRNWTHAAGGVTEYDFGLAEKIDGIIETGKSSSLQARSVR
jgi:4a-hydroxytetrahydrobiopterin dehydratase